MDPFKINEKEAAVILIADCPEYRQANHGQRPNKKQEFSIHEYEETLKQLVSDHRDQKYDFYVAYAPENMFIEMERIVGRISGFPQKGSNEGEKILNAFKQVTEKYGKVIVINKVAKESDSSSVQKALDMLNENKIVMKKTGDGEYYFIGMEVKGMTKPFNLFDSSNISWGTDAVLNETLKIMQLKMLAYGLL